VTRRFVLDSWAVLALIQKEEPAASRVRVLLAEAASGQVDLYLSIINLGEVYYRIGRVRIQSRSDQIVNDIRHLAVTILPASEEAVFAAARFKMRHTISYADAFAAAAADLLGATLVTGDPELIALAGRISIEPLRRGP
jgi:predicted nucleic acid-binding protein